MASSEDPPPKAGVMASAGEYARDSETQHGAAAIGFELIAPAIEAAELGAGDAPLLIADFGAAQGTNSLEPTRLALDALGRRHGGRPVLCVHTDIPGNDFTTLCETLERSPDSYVRDHPEALPLMAGRSLFGSCLPAGQLRFGWTASTLHWLSDAPGPVAGHFFVQLSGDADAQRAYAERSARDWRDFLDGRAAELAPGAAVVIVDVAMDGDGLMGSEALFDRLNDALLELGEEGLLNAGELDRAVYPTRFRSLDELRAPFDPLYRAPTGERLELVDVTPRLLEDPFRAAFERSGDARAYGTAQAGFLEGFLGPSFASALDPDRSESDRAETLRRLWETAARLIAAEPQAVSPSYRLLTALVRRTG